MTVGKDKDGRKTSIYIYKHFVFILSHNINSCIFLGFIGL